MSLLTHLGLKPLPKLSPAAGVPPPPARPKPTARTGLADADTVLTPPADYAVPLHLSVSPAKATIDGGGELRFTATGIDGLGDEVQMTFDVAWESSNPSAVTIDANGVAHGKPVSGSAEITATHEPTGLRASANVTVAFKEPLGPVLGPPKKPRTPESPVPPKAPPRMTGLRIVTPAPLVVMNAWAQLRVNSTYDTGAGQDESQAVDWESADPDIATVDAKGRVTGVKQGTATISATDPNTSFTDWITLDVVAAELTGLTINPATASLHGAQLLQLQAVAEYSDGISVLVDKEVTWESSEPEVVRVDAAGMAIGRNSGAARITATFKTTDSKGKVIYRQAFSKASVPLLRSLVIKPADSAMLVGEQRTFTAVGIYDDGSRQDVAGVLWRSSSLEVIGFQKTGRATGRGAGTAMVTVMMEDNPAMAATTKVAVKAAAFDTVTIEMMDAAQFDGRLQLGQRLQLRAVGHAPVGSGQVKSELLPGATWSSTNIKVAMVKDGIVRALAIGDTIIAATDKGSGIGARIPLHVVAAKPVEATPLPANFEKLPPQLAKPYSDARQHRDDVHLLLRSMDNVPRLMATLNDVLADVARASDRAVDKAEKLETQSQLLNNIELQITTFEERVVSAVGALERAETAMEVHDGRVEVAELREKGKEQAKNAKLVMGLLKGAWKIVKADYVGSALELLSGALDGFDSSAYDKAADELEKKLDAKTKKMLQNEIDTVKRELALTHASIGRIKEQATVADKFFRNLREKAEEAFDAGAKKGSFKFADINTALGFADRIADVLVPQIKTETGTVIATTGKAQRNVPPDSKAHKLLHEMNSTAVLWYAEANTVFKQVDDQRRQLRDLRAKALTALAFVKPGAPKKKGGK